MDATATRSESETGVEETLREDGLGPAGDPPADPSVTDPPAGDEPPSGSGEPPTPPAALPENPGDDDEDATPDPLSLQGDRQLGLKVGGRLADSAVLKYKGGKLDLIGPAGSNGSQFDRGDRFTTVDVWQVTGDNDQDTIDKLSGEVKSTSKAQGATLCGTTRIEEYLAARLDRETLVKVCEALELDVPVEDQE